LVTREVIVNRKSTDDTLRAPTRSAIIGGNFITVPAVSGITEVVTNAVLGSILAS
jgi:hypothetical protein